MDSSMITDIIIYMLIPWMVMIERRLARVEGYLKALGYRDNRGEGDE